MDIRVLEYFGVQLSRTSFTFQKRPQVLKRLSSLCGSHNLFQGLGAQRVRKVALSKAVHMDTVLCVISYMQAKLPTLGPRTNHRRSGQVLD